MSLLYTGNRKRRILVFGGIGQESTAFIRTMVNGSKNNDAHATTEWVDTRGCLGDKEFDTYECHAYLDQKSEGIFDLMLVVQKDALEGEIRTQFEKNMVFVKYLAKKCGLPVVLVYVSENGMTHHNSLDKKLYGSVFPVVIRGPPLVSVDEFWGF